MNELLLIHRRFERRNVQCTKQRLAQDLYVKELNHYQMVKGELVFKTLLKMEKR